MVAQHLRQHDALIDLAGDILRSSTDPADRSLDELSRKRLKFARLVNQHCEEEAETVRDAVDRGIVAPALAASFRRDLMLWRADMASCNSEWPIARVMTDRHGFAARFGSLAHALEDYIERENRQILSVIAGRGPR